MSSRFSFAPFGRRDTAPWFRIGNLDVTTTVLFVGLCLFAMLLWALDGSGSTVLGKTLLEPLALVPADVRGGQLWRLLTWPFPDDVSLWWVVMLAVFWLIGSQVEMLLGRDRFAVFLLTVIVASGVFGTLIDIPAFYGYGPRTVQLCVFLVYVAEYPFARFLFGIPGWVFGVVIVAIEVIQLLGWRQVEMLFFRLFSIALALLLARGMGLLQDLPWIPNLAPSALRDGRRRRPAASAPRAPQSHRPSRFRGVGDSGQRVVQGPWGERGTGSASTSSADRGGLPQPPRSSADRLADQHELDALLDKIAAGGMDSLSIAEKDRLNELSRRIRDSR